MKFLRSLKRLVLIGAVAFAAFLTPISLNVSVNSFDSFISGESFVVGGTLSVNTAHAQFISYNCEGGVTDVVACQIGKVIATYYQVIFYVIPQVFAVITGYMLDIVMKFSISSNFYRSSGIIEVGWEVLRDITNIIFIFALLVVAFKMVVGKAGSEAKKSLINTILLALVVNFSLFMSFIIIDASNILAHVFWNRLDTDVTEQMQVGDYEGGGINVATWLVSLGVDQSPSLAIAGQINPQMIINSTGGNVGFFQTMILIFGSGALNIFLVYIFFSVMLVFFGRILGLIILVVVSPLAFASFAVPQLRKLPYVGFNSWFSELLKLSFVAPIYLFFIWLTIKFIGDKGILSTISTATTNPDDWLTPMVNTFLMLGLIGGMLLMTKKVTGMLSQGMGNMAQDAVQKAIGGTVAAASLAVTGGAAAAGMGMRAAGGVAGALGKKETAASLNRAGKQAMSLKADVTKLPGFSALVGKKNTEEIGKITGRSALGHIDDRIAKGKKEFKGAFGSEADNLAREKWERDQQDKREKDKISRWQENMVEVEAIEKIKEAREAALRNDGTLYPPGHQFAGMTKEQALAQASANANDPTKIQQHKNDVKTKEGQIETAEIALQAAKDALQTTNNAVELAKRNTDNAQKDLDGIGAKLQAAISAGDRAEANRLRVSRAGAETRLNNARRDEGDKIADKNAAQANVSTAETGVKTLKKELETLQKRAPDKALAGVQEDIRVDINLQSDQKVAAEYAAQSKKSGDVNDKISQKILQGKLKIEDKKDS